MWTTLKEHTATQNREQPMLVFGLRWFGMARASPSHHNPSGLAERNLTTAPDFLATPRGQLRAQ